ncbi:MAG: hypothetical protein KKA42_08260 [candidate division Zixibacteria bacterium]|nr:hypothetical protein [candidate division Zixibacteria bacterium]
MSFLGLFPKPHESKDPEVRLKAVESLEDQSVLAAMASTDPSPRVRLAAVARVTDQQLLTNIALDGNQIDARVAAVGRIESQQTLAKIVKVRRNYQLMGACFARITDKSILHDIANDREYNMSARRMAIENYADESYLTQIVEKRTDTDAPKTPEEIDELVERYGGVHLARALGKFRGSKNAMLALSEILKRGGEAGDIALEYLAQGLVHPNRAVSEAAHGELCKLADGRQISRLVAHMDKSELDARILAVLKNIDHPEARQIVESAGNDG